MNHNEKLLTQYLLAATKGEKLKISPPSAATLNYLYTQSKAHQIQTLVFSAFSDTKALQKVDSTLMANWTKETIFMSCYQKNHICQMEHIFSLFQEQSIPVLPLKGLFLRNLYPRPDLRIMSDADILIHEAHLKRVKQLLEDEGYTEVEDSHSYHVVFSHPKYMSIEVHWALTNHQSFNIPATIAFEKEVWEHAIPATIGTVPVLSFSLEDHLIYVCIHMAKHLNYAGFGLRQLCDFYLILNKHAQDLNWSYLTQRLVDIGLYSFFSMQLAVCHQLLDYNFPITLSNLPKHASNQVNLFIDDLFQSGVFGTSTYYRSLAVTFTKATNTKASYSTSMWQIFFPKYTKLKTNYPYLAKYPYLILIAWFQHLYQLITRKDQHLITKLKALFFTKYSMYKRKQMLKDLKL